MDYKHTPGPWYSGTDTIGTNVATAGQGLICELTSNGRRPLRGAELHQAENRQANALLIAAAPDLLEALESILMNMVDTDEYKHPETGEDFPDFVAGVNAIKKAKGEL